MARVAEETGALAIVREVARLSPILFANPGTTEMWLVAALDALAASPPNKSGPHAMRVVLGMHENVCTGAADGFARMCWPRGTPAAALLHLGPGLANGLANLHNARRARSPVIVLVGDMATWHKPADPLLATDIIALARTVARMVASPSPPGPGLPPSSPPATWRDELARVLALCTRPHCSVEGAEGPPALLEGWKLSTGPADSHVLVVTVPHDLSWQLAPRTATPSPPSDPGAPGTTTTQPSSCQPSSMLHAMAPQATAPRPKTVASHSTAWHAQATLDDTMLPEQAPLPEQALAFVRQCAAAMRSAPRGSVALYLGGEALLGGSEGQAGGDSGRTGGPQAGLSGLTGATGSLTSKGATGWDGASGGGALAQAGRAAAACGAALWCENAFARADRGVGLPHLRRLPYFPQEAAWELARYELVVVVDTRLPVANFGYSDALSQLVPERLVREDKVWELDVGTLPPGGVAQAMRALADALDPGHAVQPGLSCGGLFAAAVRRPELPMPEVALSPAVLCRCVAALQPEGCVIVDESLTSGGPYWDLSKACPPFSHLTLTGGAIGSGPPLALGAALACPGRCVINLQADGSAMYSLQALWSQAREHVHVITIICANNSYSILKVECGRQRLPAMGEATRALTDLSRPCLDWVALAQGMGVRACAARTAGELCQALQEATARSSDGPCLICAVL